MDRALTKAEMAELRSISTRAVITSTSFTNHYEWGDLKANPLKLLEKYFDAFVYVANWGKREFYLRLPIEMIRPRYQVSHATMKLRTQQLSSCLRRPADRGRNALR